MLQRHAKRWTINEVLKLQREHELLQLSVEEIALNHQRTERAIICKLVSEGWMDSSYLQKNEEVITSIDAMDMRVYKLEQEVNNIKHVVEEMVKCGTFKETKLFA